MVSHEMRCLCHSAEGALDRTVHVGVVQGAVTHVVHWLWPLPATEYDGRLADNDQHADRSDLLRPLCRPFNNADTVF